MNNQDTMNDQSTTTSSDRIIEDVEFLEWFKTTDLSVANIGSVFEGWNGYKKYKGIE